MAELFNTVTAFSSLKSALSESSFPPSSTCLEDALALLRTNLNSISLSVLRDKVFEPLQLAMESPDERVGSQALNCLHCFLRDCSLFSLADSDPDMKWLPTQFLYTVDSCTALSEERKLSILKLLLDMCLTCKAVLSANVIIRVIEMCIKMCTSQTTSADLMVLYVSQCTLKQILETVTLLYCRSEPEEFQCLVSTDQAIARSVCLPDLLLPQNQQPDDSSVSRSKVLTKKDTDPMPPSSRRRNLLLVLAYLIERLRVEIANDRPSTCTLTLLLDSVLTILDKLPTGIVRVQQFTDLTWRSLCPLLVSILQSTHSNKLLTQPVDISLDVGRGAVAETVVTSFPSSVLVTCYRISVRLSQVLGPILDMRPALESLFHAVLLYTPPRQRLEAFRAIQPMLSSAEAVMRITLPCWSLVADDSTEEPMNTFQLTSHWPVDSYHSPITRPFRLLRIIGDSIGQSLTSCGSGAVLQSAIDCLSNLLRSLASISQGEGSELWSSHPLISTQATLMICQLDILQLVPESKAKETNCVPKNASAPQSRPIAPTEQDQKLAQDYVTALERLLPSLMVLGTLPELDQMIQEFSSDFCAQLVSQDAHFLGSPDSCVHEVQNPIANADAIYVTTYTILNCNLQLLLGGFYGNSSIIAYFEVDQQAFVDSILEHNLLVYVPAGFLAQLFQMVTKNNYLGAAGFSASIADSMSSQFRASVEGRFHAPGHALYVLLINSRIQREYLTKTSERRFVSSPLSTGRILASCISCVIWQPLLDGFSRMLSSPGVLNSSTSFLTRYSSGTGSFGGQMELLTLSAETILKHLLPQRVHENLDALEIAYHNSLSCIFETTGSVHQFGLHEECLRLIEVLVCVLSQSVEQSIPTVEAVADVPNLAGAGGRQIGSIHYIQVYLLYRLLALYRELDVGSDPRFWISIFRTCRLICWLEHCNFANRPTQQGETLMSDPTGYSDDKDLTPLDALNNWFHETQRKHASSMGFVVSKDRVLLGTAGTLESEEANRVLWLLSRAVEQLIDKAALEFPLDELLCFATALVATITEPDGNTNSLPLSFDPLVDRLCQLLVTTFYTSQRPLIHLSYLWALGADPLMSVCYMNPASTDSSKSTGATTEQQRLLQQRVLTCLHTCIATQLTSNPEFPHFTVNEALCRPFATALNLERCDGELQDRIVSCICELIEAGGEYLRSAWRPLFRALRAVQLDSVSSERITPPNSSHTGSYVFLAKQILHRFRGPPESRPVDQHNTRILPMDNEQDEIATSRARRVGTVMEVFDVFLATSNVQVFCNAAVDCILCLLHYVKVGSTQSTFGQEQDYASHLNCNLIEDLVHSTEYEACNPTELLSSGPEVSLFGTSEFALDSADVENEKLIVPTTLFVPALNSLIRCIYWLERLWTMLQVPSIRDGIRQTELHCELLAPAGDNASIGDSMLQPDVTELNAMDNGSGVLHVYFLIVHQLTQLLSNRTDPIQRRLLMDHVIKLIRAAPLIFAEDVQSALFNVGPDFSLLMVNCILLPELKECVREYLNDPAVSDVRISSIRLDGDGLCSSDFDSFTPSDPIVDDPSVISSGTAVHQDLRFLRLFLGQATELVMEFVKQFAEDSVFANRVSRMFDEWMQLLQYVSTSVQCPLSHLGAVCMGHMLLHHGSQLPHSYWPSVFHQLCKALDSTLKPLEYLTCKFATPESLSMIHVECICPRDTIRTQQLQMLGRKLFHRWPPVSQATLKTDSVSISTDELPLCSSNAIDNQVASQLQNMNETTPTLVVRPKLEDIVRGLISHDILLQVGSLILLPKSLPSHLFITGKESFPMQPEWGLSDLPESHPVSLKQSYSLFLPCLVQRFNVCMKLTHCTRLQTIVRKMYRLPSNCILSVQAADSLFRLLRILVQLFFRYHTNILRYHVPITDQLTDVLISPNRDAQLPLELPQFHPTAPILDEALSRTIRCLLELCGTSGSNAANTKPSPLNPNLPRGSNDYITSMGLSPEFAANCFLQVLMEFLDFVLRIVHHVQGVSLFIEDDSAYENKNDHALLLSNVTTLESIVSETIIPLLDSLPSEESDRIKVIISEISSISNSAS